MFAVKLVIISTEKIYISTIETIGQYPIIFINVLTTFTSLPNRVGYVLLNCEPRHAYIKAKN